MCLEFIAFVERFVLCFPHRFPTARTKTKCQFLALTWTINLIFMCTCAVRPRLSPRSFYGSLIFLRLVFVRRKPHRDLQDVLHYMNYMLYAVHAPSERPTYRVTCMCNDRWQCNSIAFWQLLSAEHMVCYVPPKLESPQVSIDVSFLLLGQLLEGLSALLMWEYCDEHENYGYLRYRA